MVRSRLVLGLGAGLLVSTTLVGCFGNPFDKGDGSGVGTGRPSKYSVDQGATGGLGSSRGQDLTGPGELSPKSGSAPGVGPK